MSTATAVVVRTTRLALFLVEVVVFFLGLWWMTGVDSDGMGRSTVERATSDGSCIGMECKQMKK